MKPFELNLELDDVELLINLMMKDRENQKADYKHDVLLSQLMAIKDELEKE